MGPWDNYAAGDPRSVATNWNAMGQYTGPPIDGYTQTSAGVFSPASGAPAAYDPLSSAYVTQDYTYVPPASTPPGGFNNPAKEGYAPPPAAPPADYFTLPGAQAPAAGALPGAATGIGGGISDFGSPVATGIYGLGTAPTSMPVAPGPLPNAAATPQYASGTANSGFVSGGGGGGYSNPPASPYDAGGGMGGGMMMPNGQMFGAPKQMAPDGSFDPFLWSGTSNPMPPPGPMRTQILGELGLLPNQPMQSSNPMPPMRYVESKLGVGSGGAPALPPPPPAPQASLPVAPVGGIPNLPPPILPGARRR